jgi:hypothetical protein
MHPPEPIIYAAQEPHRWEGIECGGEVRWKAGKLQQVFIITEYVGGSPTGQRQEWRDVPTDQ